MRRRMMLPIENKVLITYQQMKNRLIELGCPTGTDEYGDWVGVQADKVGGKILFQGIFKPLTTYKMIITGYNTNTSYQNTINMRIIFTDGYNSGDKDVSGKMIETEILYNNPPIRSADRLVGVWVTGVFRLHDFRFEEV